MTLQTRYSLYAVGSAVLAASAIVMTEVAMRFYALPPLLVALYSSIIGGLLLMVPIAKHGMGFYRGWPTGDWVRFVVGSLMVFVVGMVLVFLAIDLIGSSKSAMIGRLESLFVVVLAVLILGEEWNARRWLASAITLAGTVLVNFDAEALELVLGTGELLNIVAAFAFASGIIVFKPLLHRHHPQLLTGSAMLSGALVLAPICVYLDAWSGTVDITDAEIHGPGWLSLALLIAMSLQRALSWSVYYIAMRQIGAARCSIFFLTSVVFIVILQFSVDTIAPGLGLQVPPNLLPALGGGTLIVLGIVMLQRS
jgi:drug/metabolite transporter (DMT)-like permease